MTSVRVFLLGPLLIFGIFSGSLSHAKVPGFVKKMAKNCVCKQVREFVREVCYPHGLALSPLGFGLFSFDMDRFDQLGEPEQVAMMDQFISQIGITDDFIAWHLKLYKSTVIRIRQETEKEFESQPAEIITGETAKRLTTRVRRVNFFRNNWGKMLVGAGVGLAAVTVGSVYYLNRILLNNTQLH